MCRGRMATQAAQASSTTFFSSVCPFVSVTASPKQPQSFTGFQMAIHSVTMVIRAMNSSSRRDVSLRRMAKSMRMPSANSTAGNATPMPSVSQSGSSPPSPAASA